jgi:hypothetical protein
MILYDDPITAYNDLVANLIPGQKYVQTDFDYEGNPTRRAEELFPNVPLFDANGANSYEVGQGGIGDCGTLAHLCGIAEAKNSFTIEDCIYPTTVSPYGLYMISAAEGFNKKWFAIDSNISVYPPNFKNSWMRGTAICVSPVKANPTLWATILEKGAAMRTGGKYSSLLVESVSTWLPFIYVIATTFEEFKAVTDAGGYGVITYKQPVDAAGVNISVPGIVTGHAFAVVDAIQIDNLKVVRVENPWAGGSDYNSEFISDTSPIWDSHPEFAEQLKATKGIDGAYWITFEELQRLSNSMTVECKIILPYIQYPIQKMFEYEFDDTFVNAGCTDWPNLIELRRVAASKNDKVVLTCNEPTNFYITTLWLPGSTGSRHSYVNVALDIDLNHAVPRIPFAYGWWHRPSIIKGKLEANLEYHLYPATVSETTDRGKMQIFVLADKPFNLTRNGTPI